MTRSEHIAWAKQRALEYLPGNPPLAFASLVSDLGKHPETVGHQGRKLGATLMMSGHMPTPDAMRDFINGIQ